MMEYSKKLLDHFRNPRNYGRMKNPSVVGKVGNVVCGDILELYLQIKEDKIIDVKFLTFGCVAALGVSSVLTEMVKGKTIEEAKKIKPVDIQKEVGGLPSVKAHCAVLGFESLKKAIENYENKKT